MGNSTQPKQTPHLTAAAMCLFRMMASEWWFRCAGTQRAGFIGSSGLKPKRIFGCGSHRIHSVASVS